MRGLRYTQCLEPYVLIIYRGRDRTNYLNISIRRGRHIINAHVAAVVIVIELGLFPKRIVVLIAKHFGRIVLVVPVGDKEQSLVRGHAGWRSRCDGTVWRGVEPIVHNVDLLR